MDRKFAVLPLPMGTGGQNRHRACWNLWDAHGICSHPVQTVNYLATVTVQTGKVFALFVKGPPKTFAADPRLRLVQQSFRTIPIEYKVRSLHHADLWARRLKLANRSVLLSATLTAAPPSAAALIRPGLSHLGILGSEASALLEQAISSQRTT